MGRKEKIKEVLTNKKYLTVGIIAGLIHLSIYYWQVTTTAGSFLSFAKAFVGWYVFASVPLAFLIAGLIGLTVALFAARLKEFRNFKSASASSSGGLFLGTLASGCPGCAIGLFPLVAGVFGISATLGSLPFGGVELQLVSVGLLGGSVFLLSKESKVCKVK